MTVREVPDIPGAETLVAWFGAWPTFHDAEIIHLHLNRAGSSGITIHAWNMTDKTYEADGRTFFVLEKHAVVTFELEDITALELVDFNAQNVLSALEVWRDGESFHMHLHSSYGLSGSIEAARMRVSLRPGKPSAE